MEASDAAAYLVRLRLRVGLRHRLRVSVRVRVGLRRGGVPG